MESLILIFQDWLDGGELGLHMFGLMAAGVMVENTYTNDDAKMALRPKNGIGKISQRFKLCRSKATLELHNARTNAILRLPAGFGWIRIRPEEAGGIQAVRRIYSLGVLNFSLASI
jgi:hypothetical protein